MTRTKRLRISRLSDLTRFGSCGLAAINQTGIDVTQNEDRLPFRASLVAATVYGILGVALCAASFGWENSRDTPLLNYVGWLIWEQGYAPYRDVFETSMPGALAFYAGVAGLGLT